MNIYMPYLLYFTILLVNTFPVNLQNVCKCSEFVNEADCQGICSWNKNSCEDVACSDITIQNDCILESKRCYWSQGQCKDFTNCSSILGATIDECKHQNFNCTASNSTNCGPIDQLQTCSALTNQMACNSYYSQQGICIWNEGQCVVASSCTQFYNATAHSCQIFGCYLSNFNCLPKTCSYHKTQNFCETGVEIFVIYISMQNVVACQWNSAQNVFEDFDQSTVDVDQCYHNTYGTFSWSDSKSSKGSCQQCFNKLLKIFFAIKICLFW